MIAYVYLYMGKFNFTENIYIYVYLYLSYVYIDMGIYFNVMGQMDDSASVQDGMWQSADGKDEHSRGQGPWWISQGLMVETWFKPLNHKIYGDNK